MQNSIRALKETKICCRKSEKTWWVDHPFCSRVKLSFAESTHLCKSIGGIDESQLNSYSMCQPMPIRLYTHWDLDTETGRFITRQNKTRSFKNTVMSYFQRTRPEWKDESFDTTGRQKIIDCCSGDGFCSHCNTVFEAMWCFHHFCPCQDLHPSLTEDIQRGIKKRTGCVETKLKKKQKGFTVIKMWECE